LCGKPTVRNKKGILMKYLITGGLGFIGTKIIEKLSNDGHSITCVDNEDTYDILTKVELNKLIAWRTRNWIHKNVNVIKGDVLDRMVCLKAFSHRPDIVIHLATYPRAKIVDQDPINGIPKVIGTTTNLLWHAAKFNTKKFVYISSSMVYGDFVDGTKEDSNTKPQNIYGEAKLTGERLTKLFAKRDGLNYTIVRPSGVYGPGDLPDRVVSKFFHKAMNNQTIELHNGENKVDFTYRQDAAYGIIKAAESDVANTSFNITAGNATSLRTLAETIVDITGSDSDIVDVGMHKLYPMRGTLDISRAKDLLNYKPKFTLRQGLESYYEWIQNKI
jgi:nucleoside-diphosphate-sugar epimerase